METIQVWKDWIQNVARKPYKGHLQVPTVCLGSGPYPDVIDVPAEWFMLTTSGRASVGKESGFMMVSPKGWAANKDAIEKAFKSYSGFMSDSRKKMDWDEFVALVEAQFRSWEMGNKRHKKELEKKIDNLKKAMQFYY